jgi:hypothetical protein
MWVIFRDPKTVFNHVDKYVVELVEDKDILTYQELLQKTLAVARLIFTLTHSLIRSSLPLAMTSNTTRANTRAGVRSIARTDPRWKRFFPGLSQMLSTYLEPSGMTHHTVNECADYADWLVVLDDGTGFLMLESNQITLIGIAPESRGKGYVKVLVNEAQRYAAVERSSFTPSMTRSRARSMNRLGFRRPVICG